MKHAELCRLIPHSGAMCLLDEVISWDEKRIVCRSNSHRRMDNPLRDNNRLAVVHGIEYGAQAMAVHGRLLNNRDSANPGVSYLAALRNVAFHVDWLDDIIVPLDIEAVQILSDKGHSIYQISVLAAERTLLSGQATVMTPRSSL